MFCYRIPRPKIIYEVLNNEVIVIDFDTGNYYALIHVAKQIWQWIEQRVSIEKISQLLADYYKLDSGVVFSDVQRFFDELLEEGLIERTEGVAQEVDLVEVASPGWGYDAPRLQKYTDVQNLLLLDPIHEVTEVGWPDPLG